MVPLLIAATSHLHIIVLHTRTRMLCQHTAFLCLAQYAEHVIYYYANAISLHLQIARAISILVQLALIIDLWRNGNNLFMHTAAAPSHFRHI